MQRFIYYANITIHMSMRYNPFNPQTPAKPEFFVGRFNEIKTFERYLFQTINSSPMCMAVGGNRGIGKTSILTKFAVIAKSEKCLVVRISNLEGGAENVIELSDFILSNLKLEFMSSGHIILSDKIKEFLKSLNLSLSIGDASLDVSLRRDATIGIFRRRLEEFWNYVKKDFTAIVILIDEAESVERIDGALMFLREVFQRLSQESIKYMVVLCGKLNFSEIMSEAFSPLNRFFPSTRLVNLNEEETLEFLEKSLDVVKCKIEKTAAQIIYEKSEGHPYIVVSMAFNIFNELGKNEYIITKKLVEINMNLCEIKLEQDYFLSLFHPLTPKSKEILLKIASKLNKTEFTFSDAVRILDTERSHVSPYIIEMYRKGCINKLERGKYEIFHGMFLNFLKRKASTII